MARTLLALTLVMLVACDPRMTMRQVNSAAKSSENPVARVIPEVSIDVKNTHQFVGEMWYSPQVIAANSSDVPITIISVESFAEGAIFEILVEEKFHRHKATQRLLVAVAPGGKQSCKRMSRLGAEFPWSRHG